MDTKSVPAVRQAARRSRPAARGPFNRCSSLSFEEGLMEMYPRCRMQYSLTPCLSRLWYCRYVRPMDSSSPFWPNALCAADPRESNDRNRFFFRFDLRRRDALGGARAVLVHRCSDAVVRPRAGQTLGRGLDRGIRCNRLPTSIEKAELALSHDPSGGSTGKSDQCQTSIDKDG